MEDPEFLFMQGILVKLNLDLLLQAAFLFGEQGVVDFKVIVDVVEVVRAV